MGSGIFREMGGWSVRHVAPVNRLEKRMSAALDFVFPVSVGQSRPAGAGSPAVRCEKLLAACRKVPHPRKHDVTLEARACEVVDSKLIQAGLRAFDMPTCLEPA